MNAFIARCLTKDQTQRPDAQTLSQVWSQVLLFVLVCFLNACVF